MKNVSFTNKPQKKYISYLIINFVILSLTFQRILGITMIILEKRQSIGIGRYIELYKAI